MLMSASVCMFPPWGRGLQAVASRPQSVVGAASLARLHVSCVCLLHPPVVSLGKSPSLLHSAVDSKQGLSTCCSCAALCGQPSCIAYTVVQQSCLCCTCTCSICHCLNMAACATSTGKGAAVAAAPFLPATALSFVCGSDCLTASCLLCEDVWDCVLPHSCQTCRSL